VRAGRALLLVALLQSSCLGPPPTVDRITIANPTDYQLDVDVTGEDRQGWLPVAILEPGSERPVGEVIDQGEIWIFRFLYLGDPVMEVSVTRDELEGSDWRVVVPAEVEQRLRERDAQRSG
jgi:hypothetical protein